VRLRSDEYLDDFDSFLREIAERTLKFGRER
jgi:hypothetical protein